MEGIYCVYIKFSKSLRLEDELGNGNCLEVIIPELKVQNIQKLVIDNNIDILGMAYISFFHK